MTDLETTLTVTRSSINFNFFSAMQGDYGMA